MTDMDAPSFPSASLPTIEDVQAAIEKLPAFEREIFYAHRADGLSFAEIAGRYGISVERVEGLLVRSLGRIRRRIERAGRRRR